MIKLLILNSCVKLVITCLGIKREPLTSKLPVIRYNLQAMTADATNSQRNFVKESGRRLRSIHLQADFFFNMALDTDATTAPSFAPTSFLHDSAIRKVKVEKCEADSSD